MLVMQQQMQKERWGKGASLVLTLHGLVQELSLHAGGKCNLHDAAGHA